MVKHIGAIDVGNSRVKWRIGLGETHVAESVSALAVQWQAAAKANKLPLHWMGSNVRGSAIALEIDDVMQDIFGQAVRWQQSVRTACGVVNAYDIPEQLGVDRWAAMLAAHAASPHQACTVIDAGTAITVDTLDQQGVHRGGIIMPGISTMLASLDKGTGLISSMDTLDDMQSVLQSTQKSTQSAVLAGVLFAVQGGIQAAIKHQAQQINGNIEDMNIWLTGGDAQKLKLQGMRPQYAPDLVLQGLQLMGECA
ncbi:MAG: type III pantothenate kinase [Arenicellales bacterium]